MMGLRRGLTSDQCKLACEGPFLRADKMHLDFMILLAVVLCGEAGINCSAIGLLSGGGCLDPAVGCFACRSGAARPKHHDGGEPFPGPTAGQWRPDALGQIRKSSVFSNLTH